MSIVIELAWPSIIGSCKFKLTLDSLCMSSFHETTFISSSCQSDLIGFAPMNDGNFFRKTVWCWYFNILHLHFALNWCKSKIICWFRITYQRKPLKTKLWVILIVSYSPIYNVFKLSIEISMTSGNALERVQRVHEPADLWDITFCTRWFWGF